MIVPAPKGWILDGQGSMLPELHAAGWVHRKQGLRLMVVLPKEDPNCR